MPRPHTNGNGLRPAADLAESNGGLEDGPPLSKAERLEKVDEMLGQEMTHREVAAQLHISERTVRRYAATLRDSGSETVREQQNPELVGFTLLRGARIRSRHLWEIYRLAGTDLKVRVSVLKELRELERQQTELMQSLGLTYVAPTRVDALHRFLARINTLNDEQLEAISSARPEDVRVVIQRYLPGEEIPEDLDQSPANGRRR